MGEELIIMKLLKAIKVVLALGMSGVAAATPVVFEVTLPADVGNSKTELSIHNGPAVDLQSDASGVLSATFDIDAPVYATFYYNNTSTLLWLNPGDSISLSFTSGADSAVIGGTRAAINRHLNHNAYRFAMIDDSKRDENDFLNFVDSLNAANHRILDNTPFEDTFKTQESGRITYENALAMTFYPEFHPRLKPDSTYKPSETFYGRLRDITRYDGDLLVSKSYTNYIMGSFGLLSRHELPDIKGYARITQYLDSCVCDPRVKEYIFDRYARSSLIRRGPEEARPYIDDYARYVSDKDKRDSFDKLYTEIMRLSPGQPSPLFNCERPDGSRATLGDYAGKWVYIDIWATWCGPCRREIPHLRKLEEKYKDSPIEFVSISTDNDRDAWTATVKNQNMQGEQLRFDGNDTFMDSYKVTGIPRFILLDPEGRIVNSDMTRPSDPATVRILDNLLK